MSAHNSRFSLNGDGKQSPSVQLGSADERKKKIIHDLDCRFAELNKLWQLAEADLKQIPIPVDVFSQYKSEDAYHDRPNEFTISHFLAFARCKGSWRICYGCGCDAFPEEPIDWKPITECSLDIRMEAVPSIVNLRAKVLEAAEASVPSLDKAIGLLRLAMNNWDTQETF